MNSPIDLSLIKTESIQNKLDDKARIDSFLSKQPDKKVVVVQGLGFVGAVMSIVCANALTEEYAVIGVDLPIESSLKRIKEINDGKFPIASSDPKVEQYFQRAKEKGNLFATYDPYAYSKADIIIVDVNLDVQKSSSFKRELNSFDVDLSGFKKAIETIGNHCRAKVLVLVETTVPPGTCEKVVKPIIENCLKKRGLSPSKFHIGHSYERVMPGPEYIDSIQNFYRVYSGINEASAVATEQFLKTIISTDKYPLTRLGNTTATEMAKVLENSYRAMNIAFAVEWSRFAEESGVNLYEVVKAIRMRPTHANLMLPGIGVGGYCLTKDPLLASWARQRLFEKENPLGQSEQGVRINDKMPLYAFEFLEKEYGDSLKDKSVLLLGVSYRGDVGDTRYSPVEPFYDYLSAAGCRIYLCDPYVPFWQEKDLEVASSYLDLFKENLDIVVFSAGHSQFKENPEILSLILKQDQLMVLDTLGILSDKEILSIQEKHKVRVVGRGDLK